MSFYNPNIQAAFEADEKEYIPLKKMTLAVYRMIFRQREGCRANKPEDLRAVYQLEFIRLSDSVQQDNLKFSGDDFVKVLADVTLEVISGRVKTFDDYIRQKAMVLRPGAELYSVLYTADRIQDFIEMLVYSDISSTEPSSGVRDFTKVFGISDDGNGHPVYYTLYERLKLYARLFKVLQLVVDRDKMIINGRQVDLELEIRL